MTTRYSFHDSCRGGAFQRFEPFRPGARPAKRGGSNTCGERWRLLGLATSDHYNRGSALALTFLSLGSSVLIASALLPLAKELRAIVGEDSVLAAHAELVVYECDGFVIEKNC